MLFESKKENYKDKKVLLFILVGQMKITQQVIQIREILIPYAKDYDTCIEEAKERQNNHDAPIEDNVPDLSDYEVIYIGSPVYWSDMPEELVTALKDIDFTGKIIRPFTTHEGSGLGSIPSQIKRVCKGAIVTDGLAVRGTMVYQFK